MMDSVADNEHPPPGWTPEGERTPPTGLPAQPEPGGELSVRPPSEPTPAVDPEAVRQFQQFQQFQELMRQQQEQGFPQGTPPPPGFLQPWGQPPKRPLWQRFLRSKLFRQLVLLLVVVIGLYWAYQHYFGGEEEHKKPSESGVVGTENNLRLPDDPYEAVRMVYQWVAQNSGPENTDQVCLRFRKEARDEFARNLGYRDCPEAVQALHAQVTDKNAYARSMPRHAPRPVTGSTAEIHSCADSLDKYISGGPALGVFTLRIIAHSKGGQWEIVGHHAEPACTAPPSATTPTTR